MTLTVAECAGVLWDAVVVGTGVGGATVGHELARRGHRVLFIEKGPFLHAGFDPAPDELCRSIVGSRESPSAKPQDSFAAQRLAAGRWPHRVRALTNLGMLNFAGPVGCISGGSSAFYAAALERFAPTDFRPRANFPTAPSSTLPERWPLSYEELAPFYAQAETIFRVRGTQDPLFTGGASELLEPPPLSPRDQRLYDIFSSLGLHPYRAHVGCEFVAGCTGCPTGPCERACKQDAAWACLIPALTRHGAAILPECEVLRVETEGGAVRELVCRRAHDELRIRARTVILAAGAFASPVLLLRSRSPEWPQGIGNQHDLVGRNLMFHGGDYIAVSPGAALDANGPQKTLAINDFYLVDGEKLGTFQTLGVRLEVGQIMQYLRETAELSTAWYRWLLKPEPAWWRKLMSPFVRLGALVYFYIFNFRDAAVWVSIVEDLPYRENRVYPDPANAQDIIIEYCYSDDMKQRVAKLRERLRTALGPRRMMVLSAADKIDYPHVCGTCRFGDDPTDSVLDRNNRVHGMDNLYVVDASCFPSSGGTNPSLTIAANALRVAGVIDERLRQVETPAVSSAAHS